MQESSDIVYTDESTEVLAPGIKRLVVCKLCQCKYLIDTDCVQRNVYDDKRYTKCPECNRRYPVETVTSQEDVIMNLKYAGRHNIDGQPIVIEPASRGYNHCTTCGMNFTYSLSGKKGSTINCPHCGENLILNFSYKK